MHSIAKTTALSLALALTATACKKAPDEEASDALIYGGSPVASDDPLARFTVALAKPDGRVFCTGTLVGQSVVATAAHCLKPGYVEGGINVVFGAVAKGGTAYPMKHFEVHPEYNPANTGTNSAPNDLGVIFLDQVVQDRQPVLVLESQVPVEPYEAAITIAGFGITDVGAGNAGTLRAAVTTLSATGHASKEIFTDGFRVHNACNGDSGGPALVTHQTNGYYVLGIASYVIAMSGRVCNSGYAAYTDLRAHKAWLTNALSQASSFWSQGTAAAQ